MRDYTYGSLVSKTEDLSPSCGRVLRCEGGGGEGEWGGGDAGREEGRGGEGGSWGSSVPLGMCLLRRMRGRDGG